MRSRFRQGSKAYDLPPCAKAGVRKPVCDDPIPPNLPLRNDLIGEEPYGAPQLDVPVPERQREPACAGTGRMRHHRQALVRGNRPHTQTDTRTVSTSNCVRHSGLPWPANRYPSDIRTSSVGCQRNSNEIMLQLVPGFGGPGRTSTRHRPTYPMYPEYARDTLHRLEARLHRNAGLHAERRQLLEVIAEVKPSMVLLTSAQITDRHPLLPMEDIGMNVFAARKPLKWSARARACNPILVIDEAYVDSASPAPERRRLIKDPNLAVSRTMSKAFAFAGARVGYLAASKGIIDCVRIVRMPYHLFDVTQAAVLAAFEHTDEQLEPCRAPALKPARPPPQAQGTGLTKRDQPLKSRIP